MQEYLVTLLGKEKRKSLRLTYLNGLLLNVNLPEQDQFTEMEIVWLCNWLRSQVKEDELHTNCGDPSTLVKFRVAKVDQDLSFQAFWDAYDHKIGNKKRAEKLWMNMSKGDKIRGLIGVRAYNYWLSLHTNTEKLYPETFLHQRRYENEYKI